MTSGEKNAALDIYSPYYSDFKRKTVNAKMLEHSF